MELWLPHDSHEATGSRRGSDVLGGEVGHREGERWRLEATAEPLSRLGAASRQTSVHVLSVPGSGACYWPTQVTCSLRDNVLADTAQPVMKGVS